MMRILLGFHENVVQYTVTRLLEEGEAFIANAGPKRKLEKRCLK